MQFVMCNLKDEKSGLAMCARREACPPLSAPRSPLGRRGFTLIELLVVILIISILAALVLGVAAVAGETARQAQSKHIVERLHTLLTEFYDTYKARRVSLRPTDTTGTGIEAQINARYSRAADRGQAIAEARMYAMRELMLMEVPDRWSDVLLADIGANDSDPPASVEKAPLYLASRTELSSVYLRRYKALIGRTNTISGTVNTAGDIRNNQGAECLYMIVTLACGDGEARSQFKEADIGDTDGDGAPEFLDGWRHPVNFLRWPAGFDSQIEPNANALQTTDKNSSTTFWTTVAAKDHDPFDLFRRDPFAFRLVPLIYSPGRDETSGLNAAESFVTWRNSNVSTLSFNSSGPPFIQSPILTPYVKGSPPSFPNDYIGSNLHVVNGTTYPDDNAADNVHNHLLGLR